MCDRNVLTRADIVEIFKCLQIDITKFPFHVFVAFITCIDKKSFCHRITVQAAFIFALNNPFLVLKLQKKRLISKSDSFQNHLYLRSRISILDYRHRHDNRKTILRHLCLSSVHPSRLFLKNVNFVELKLNSLI